MVITYLLIIAILAVCLLHLLLNYNEKARILRKIPGPKDYFLVGNAGEVSADPVLLFKLRTTYAKIFNGIYRIWIYPLGIVNIFNPEDIETIISTTKHSEKSLVYKFLKGWLNQGLLLSNGAKWHQRRKILTPTFHFSILRQFCAIMEENSSRLVDKLNTILEEPVSVSPLISEFTLNSICETAMGTQLNDETSQSAKAYKQAIYDLGEIIVKRFIQVFYYSDFIFNMSKLGSKQIKCLEIVQKFTKKVIQNRRTLAAEQKQEHNEDDGDERIFMNKKRRTAMLDLLISAENEGLIDEKGIQEEVDTFMFEGHDTTASGLTFFIMNIANNQDVQEKIVEEIKGILGNSRENASIDDFSKMRYLDCCIKESLRLYPPVHFISRNISETVQLSNYTVPAGSLCHIHIYDLHRREDLFENPLEFNPDRFLPENCAKRHPYAYIPFSAGPRNCIGQKFAILEMKSAVVAILRNFRLLPITRPEDIVPMADIVLRNNRPVYVKFARRID